MAEQRRIVRVMNDIRAAEALADAARVQVKNLNRSINFARREYPAVTDGEVDISALEYAVEQFHAAADAVHDQLQIVANTHGVHVPEDNEDGGIIINSGGSKGGGG